MSAIPKETYAQIKATFRLWWEKPQVFVREVFGITPDAWQDEVLEAFPHHPRQALKACKGPGKTAVLAWLSWCFLRTRPYPKIVATSVSSDNLRDNLWSEMAKWQQKARAGVLSDFQWTAERIFHKSYPERWWMSARSWSKSADKSQQANTLAGLHEDYVMALLDESGGIPDAVMASTEGIGSSAIEWHILQAGNPTHLEGPLYRACTVEKHMWWVREITGDPDDPMRSPRVSVQWAREQIDKYGRDNPWVLINVFGQFPPSSLNALIGPDEVNAAMRRHLRLDQYAHAARTLGVDVARFGDDPSVIFPRQGLAAFAPTLMRNVDSLQGAGSVARKWADWDADAAFVDATGGYGGGWCDALRGLGRQPIEVQFAGKPNDPRYYNKRSEIWFEGCQWIKDGGALPDVPEMVGELTVPTYTFKGDKLLVEDKDQVKLRLGRSTNYPDALFTTFAQPVYVARTTYGLPIASRAKTDYDPFQERN